MMTELQTNPELTAAVPAQVRALADAVQVSGLRVMTARRNLFSCAEATLGAVEKLAGLENEVVAQHSKEGTAESRKAALLLKFPEERAALAAAELAQRQARHEVELAETEFSMLRNLVRLTQAQGAQG